MIEKLAAEQADFTVVFYNPNIQPEEEYRKRCDENKRLCAALSVPFVALEYDTERWCSLTQGLEKEPERGRRCDICFEMRLRRAMEYAQTHGFDAVASVLGVSRWKDLDQVNRAAARAEAATGGVYEAVEGRKGGMQERRAQLIRELNLYNQEYCGCPFSFRK